MDTKVTRSNEERIVSRGKTCPGMSHSGREWVYELWRCRLILWRWPNLVPILFLNHITFISIKKFLLTFVRIKKFLQNKYFEKINNIWRCRRRYRGAERSFHFTVLD